MPADFCKLKIENCGMQIGMHIACCAWNGGARRKASSFLVFNFQFSFFNLQNLLSYLIGESSLNHPSSLASHG
jgi:hypothetical protein